MKAPLASSQPSDTPDVELGSPRSGKDLWFKARAKSRFVSAVSHQQKQRAVDGAFVAEAALWQAYLRDEAGG